MDLHMAMSNVHSAVFQFERISLFKDNLKMQFYYQLCNLLG